MRKISILLLCSVIIISCKKDGREASATPSWFDPNQPRIYAQGSTASSSAAELFSMNMDGSDIRQITHFSSNFTNSKHTGHPAISPDGKTVYFVSGKDRQGGEIFSMSPDNTGLKKIISNNVQSNFINGVTLFQNGQKLLYFMETGTGMNKHGEVFTANADGSNVQQLTTQADGNALNPCVNPANSKIVYSNLIGDSIKLYIMDIDGSNKRQLIYGGIKLKMHPQFSPDGSRIIYCGPETGISSEIFIMNADGSNSVQLTDYSNHGTRYATSGPVAFSKDGRTIYYSSDYADGIRGHLYSMNIDGSNKKQLTNHPLYSFFNPCVR